MGSNAIPACSLSREYIAAVDLDEDALVRLDELIRGFASNVRYTAVLADKSSLKFASIGRLVAYENSKARAILKVRISADEPEKMLTIEITSETEYSKPVTLDIHGPDDQVVAFISRFDAWRCDVERGRLYSLFARQSWFSLGVFAVATLWLGVLVAAAALSIARGDWSLTESKPHENSPLGTILAYAVGFGGPVLLAFGLDRIRRAYFPVAYFQTGQGAKRLKQLEASRNAWFFGIVPLAIGIVGLVVAFRTC